MGRVGRGGRRRLSWAWFSSALGLMSESLEKISGGLKGDMAYCGIAMVSMEYCLQAQKDWVISRRS